MNIRNKKVQYGYFFAFFVIVFFMTGCAKTKTVETVEKWSDTEQNAFEKDSELVGKYDVKLFGKPFKIGAIYSYSGNNAAIGTNILRGIEFAACEINAAGGINGRPIEIVRADTQGDPYVASSIAEKIIRQDKVNAIIGCHQSVLTEVVSEVCRNNKIPMITAISTVNSITADNNEYFFRLCPTNVVYLENMFQYLEEQSVKTISVLADNSMIGQEVIECAEIYAKQYDMEIIKKIKYGQGAVDLTQEVTELKEAAADAVLAESYVADAILLMETMEKVDYKPPVLIAKANGFTDPSFIPGVHGLAEGLTSVVEWNPDMKKGQDINKRFKEIFGVDMNGHSAEAYTAVWTLKTAFEQAENEDGESIKNTLANLDIKETFPNGPEIMMPYNQIKFENHQFNKKQYYNDNTYASVAIAQIQKGKYKTVWPLEYSDDK